MLALGGCSTLNLKPGTAKVKIIADPDINPTPLGQPAPTLVRIFTLRNDTAFMQADFLSLADQPAATLGDDLLDKREYVMVPRSKQQFAVSLTEEAGFFGIIAGFREIETARWRALSVLEPHSENMVEIELSGFTVVVRSALYKAYGWW